MSNGVTIQGWKKLNGRECYICTAHLKFGKADTINELYTVELCCGDVPIIQIDVWVDVMIIEIKAKASTLHSVQLIRADIVRDDLLEPSTFITKLYDMINNNVVWKSYLQLVAEIENDKTPLRNPY